MLRFIQHEKLKIFFVLFLFTSACTQTEEIESLKKNVEHLQSRIDSLNSEIEAINLSRSFESILNNSQKSAFLTPGTDGYSTIKCDLGILTISLVNIIEYANGSKTTLKFGNTLSADINGVSFDLQYGPLDQGGTVINERAKYKNFVLSKSLQAGAWTNIDIVLEGILPENFGYVTVKNVTHRGIQLLR